MPVRKAATSRRGLCLPTAWGAPCSARRERICGEAHPETLDEVGHAVGVHLQRVALAELPELLGCRLGDAAEIDELGEETLTWVSM